MTIVEVVLMNLPAMGVLKQPDCFATTLFTTGTGEGAKVRPPAHMWKERKSAALALSYVIPSN